MIVFKTFLKVLNKYKLMIILYTGMLVIFGGLSMKSSNTSTNFIATKPDVFVVNKDLDSKITKNLINYLDENTNIKKIKNDEGSIDDALFYRDVNYVIYIPSGYGQSLLDENAMDVETKSTNDYPANLANNIVDNYIKLAMIYSKYSKDEDVIVKNINKNLKKQSKITITSKLNTNDLSKLNRYYSFLNYTLLAGAIYVICLILFVFRSEMISKRTIISSTNYSKFNIKLILCNLLFAFALWSVYIILSFVLFKNIMTSKYGLLYSINSFVFVICSVSVAFLLSSIVKNKGAISGLVNVVALGSSFLCGAFVPMEWLPNYVVNISKILPSYWYIYNNELIQNLDVINFNNLKPLINNMIIIVIFTIIYIIISILILRKRRKFA